MRARLLGAYRSQYSNPLRFRTGQIVEVGVRDEEWPAFAWVRTNDGRAGWAPVAWLQLLDDCRAEVLCDYDALELDVENGEMVNLHYVHGGWWWF